MTSSKPITLSVVILTHNRAVLLAGCLKALAKQSRRADEIVVVDNGSTDATHALLEEIINPPESGDDAHELILPGVDFEALLGLPIKIVEGVPEKGWAVARNLGIREASGDWVVFTDDDCAPFPDWLEQIEKLAAQDFDALGGAVLPGVALAYPRWWHPDMAWAVGLSVQAQTQADTARPSDYAQTANWATRREILLKEPFQEISKADLQNGDKNLKKRKKLYQGGREDAELWRRLRRLGYRCRFDPALRVKHFIDPRRLRWRELTRRAFHDGVALQRREPRSEFLTPAVERVLFLPLDLLFGIWGGPRPPLGEAALRVFHAIRQWGQCREWIRAKGWIKGAGHLAYLGLRLSIARTIGFCKRQGRWLGVGLIRLKRKRKKAHPGGKKGGVYQLAAGQERSIVIAAVGYVGDMLLLHPFISALSDLRPEVLITLITNPQGESLFRYEPSVRHILVVGRPEDTPASAAKTIRTAIRQHRAELILVPYFYGIHPKALFSRPEARLVTFSEEVGFPRRRWYDLADKRLPKPQGAHEAHNLYHLFHEAGFKGRLSEAPLAFLPEEVEEITQWVAERRLSKSNFVLIAPGSGQPEKFWVEERWSEVLRYLAEEYHLRVMLVGAPSEEPLCRRIREGSGLECEIWCERDLRKFALIISHARLMVCCDSGAKHLAVAVDTPTLSLFGPTDERQWGAIRLGAKHGVVRGCTWDLTEEERTGLPERHQMKCIDTLRVLRALDEMLSER